jgi:hypothetical protein
MLVFHAGSARQLAKQKMESYADRQLNCKVITAQQASGKNLPYLKSCTKYCFLDFPPRLFIFNEDLDIAENPKNPSRLKRKWKMTDCFQVFYNLLSHRRQKQLGIEKMQRFFVSAGLYADKMKSFYGAKT